MYVYYKISYKIFIFKNQITIQIYLSKLFSLLKLSEASNKKQLLCGNVSSVIAFIKDPWYFHIWVSITPCFNFRVCFIILSLKKLHSAVNACILLRIQRACCCYKAWVWTRPRQYSDIVWCESREAERGLLANNFKLLLVNSARWRRNAPFFW